MENGGLLWLFLWLPVVLTDAKDDLTEILYQVSIKSQDDFLQTSLTRWSCSNFSSGGFIAWTQGSGKVFNSWT
jgi:hypothetical protein